MHYVAYLYLMNHEVFLAEFSKTCFLAHKSFNKHPYSDAPYARSRSARDSSVIA